VPDVRTTGRGSVQVEDGIVGTRSPNTLSPGRDGDNRRMADPDARNSDTAWFEQPKELRTLQVLTHVMMNLRDLVRWACDESPLNRTALTFPVYIACVDAFFTNARLAAEFFWKMPAQDLTAHSILESWCPPEESAERMQRVWFMASKHIVHLSQARVPGSPTNWHQEDLSLAALGRITKDAFGALELFVDSYESHGRAHAQWLREMYNGTRPMTEAELQRLRRGAPKPAPVILEWW
jgi:hypothetical protein